MYVNDWTRDVGPRGREAVRRFLGEAADLGLVPRVTPEFQER
jgi:1,4-dihydroxy-6-naphthoate synthase